jgi:hypothetical protein
MYINKKIKPANTSRPNAIQYQHKGESFTLSDIV